MPLSRRAFLGTALAVAACGPGTAGSPRSEPAASAEGPLFPARVDERWGWIDRRGTMVIAPQWADAEPFAEGLAVVGTRRPREDGGVSWTETRQGFVDRTGRVAIPLRWDRATSFSEGLAAVQVKDRGWGFVDRTGAEVIAPQYEEAAPFSEGLAAVKRDGRTGLVDRTGRVVVPFRYDRAAWMLTLHEDRAVAWLAEPDRAGYVDRTGAMVIPPRWAYAQPFREGLALVQEELSDPVSFIDRDGRVVVRTDGVEGLSFCEGLAAVRRRDGWTYVDRTGATVIGPLPYRHVGAFADGRAAVARGDRWGFIDRTGREVIPTTWTGVSRFEHGLARMESGHLFRGLKLAWIDTAGRVVWQER